MALLKSALHWVGAKVGHFRDLISGDDLRDAHTNSGYNHEHDDHVTPGM